MNDDARPRISIVFSFNFFALVRVRRLIKKIKNAPVRVFTHRNSQNEVMRGDTHSRPHYNRWLPTLLLVNSVAINNLLLSCSELVLVA